MSWIESIDLRLFDWVNQSLSHSTLDVLMIVASSQSLALWPLLVAIPLLWWRGSTRLRVCLAFLVVALAVGDGLVYGPLKELIGRPRPFEVMPEARVLVGRGQTASLPSSHAANWFAAAAVLFWFYRRSLVVMLPFALAVGFSRVYVGVHYPGDVLGGALVGMAVAGGLIGGADWLWATLGRRWFPLWHARLPSLRTGAPPPTGLPTADKAMLGQHWLRLGYLLVGGLLLARWAYLASGTIELSEDEAYQWLWSKHLALSYYSKPPMIAYAQFLGTSLWGDTEFGVRFCAPLIAALLSVLMLRFFARVASPQTGFWLLVMATATPLLAVGATLLTIDPLSVLFWMAAMMAGWRAVETDSTGYWLWAGCWMGLGFLSKYVVLLQWLSWALFLTWWAPARRQWRRPGLYLALGINLVLALPVLWWNAQHDWIGLVHVSERGGLDRAWQPTLKYFGEFLGAQLGLLNPVFFVAILAAAVGLRRRENRDGPRLLLFCMGAPLFLACVLWTLRARVQPNWIAPAVVPLLGLAALHWWRQWERGARWLKPALAIGIAGGLTTVGFLHETEWIGKLTGRRLPVELDPLRRVRAWRATAETVGEARQRLLAEGRPVFIIGDHYGITALISFYLPEARDAVTIDPLVYCLSADRPKNQFHLWPGYRTRRGSSAIFVRQTGKDRPLPARLGAEFARVEDWGTREVRHRKRVFRSVQLAACRDLRGE